MKGLSPKTLLSESQDSLLLNENRAIKWNSTASSHIAMSAYGKTTCRVLKATEVRKKRAVKHGLCAILPFSRSFAKVRRAAFADLRTIRGDPFSRKRRPGGKRWKPKTIRKQKKNEKKKNNRLGINYIVFLQTEVGKKVNEGIPSGSVLSCRSTQLAEWTLRLQVFLRLLGMLDRRFCVVRVA